MSEPWFDVKKTINMRSIELNKIEDIVRKNKDKYKHASHFIRCGIMKELKENGVSTSTTELNF